MKRKTRRRSRALLLVLVAIALATAGVVYAHWTETLHVEARVVTGTADMRYVSAGTDDDGIPDTWEIVGETVAQNGTNYDHWDAGKPAAQRTSSNDPSSPIGGSRYDKDVGRCRVTSRTAQVVNVLVENAYPSYYCTIRGSQGNFGSVPMKDQALRVEVCETNCGDPGNWVAVPFDIPSNRFWYGSELEFANRPQNWCGRQFDPGFQTGWQVWLHVRQDAPQGTTYQVRFTSEFVNWNEWSLDACEGYDEWGDGSGSQKYPITP